MENIEIQMEFEYFQIEMFENVENLKSWKCEGLGEWQRVAGNEDAWRNLTSDFASYSVKSRFEP